jgi:hypothetical protein
MQGDWKWYLTVQAVKEWMRLTGRRGELEETNPEFMAAQDELGAMSMTFRLAETASGRETSGASIYRGRIMVRGKSKRAECTVMPAVRTEGSLPQLVRVTLK